MHDLDEVFDPLDVVGLRVHRGQIDGRLPVHRGAPSTTAATTTLTEAAAALKRTAATPARERVLLLLRWGRSRGNSSAASVIRLDGLGVGDATGEDRNKLQDCEVP
jgi:hypothetical protein